MLPVSLHHDGFAVLARTDSIEDDLERLAEAASKDLAMLGLRPVTLELSEYQFDVLREESSNLPPMEPHPSEFLDPIYIPFDLEETNETDEQLEN